MTEQINVDQLNNRTYEVSVWTIQDSFITVLKWSDSRQKGTIQDPKMSINTDGTQNFSFNIPMSLYIDNKWKENPIWYNTTNGNLITNMRKIKVIFNKKKENEAVFEFVITKIEMRHASGVPSCTITCENGLAFHELGKRGYKIVLSSKGFETADNAAFKNETNLNNEGTDGIIQNDPNYLAPTIDYWCGNKDTLNLTRADSDNEIVDPRKWYYRVEMDWSSYSNVADRDSHTIYDDEYISSWDENGDAAAVELYREKWHLMEESNSNLYNLTQNIAQGFGVYCRYRYLYDDNYHIVGRLIIFYNNFFNEKDGTLHFTYPYSTNEITRTIDSTDTITKLFVDTIEDNSTVGFLSIVNTEANRTKEDYLLNFDYLRSVGTISQAQYNEINIYEKEIREKNLQIIPLQEKINALYQERITVEANKTTADNGRILAEEQLNNIEDEISALANADDTDDGKVSFTMYAPYKAVPIPYNVTKNGEKITLYKVSLDMKGIIGSSIHIYSDIPTIGGNNSNLEIKEWGLDVSNGKIIGVKNMVINGTAPALVFIAFDYNPAAYYTELTNTWLIRKNKYNEEYSSYSEKLITIDEQISTYENQLESLLQEKEEIIEEFELMMGPALREGHWTPENQNDYGDKYIETLQFPEYTSESSSFPLETAMNNHIQAIWDNQLFEDEQKNYYYYGVNKTKRYYPHIRLTENLYNYLYAQLQAGETVSVVYYSYSANEIPQEQDKTSHWQSIPIGGGAEIITVAEAYNGVYNIYTDIIITAAEEMTDEEIAHMKSTAFLSVVSVEKVENTYKIVLNDATTFRLTWVRDEELENNITQVYPRLKFDTLGLKSDTEDVIIKYNHILLNDFEDYTILTRDAEYYITLKPKIMFLNGHDFISGLQKDLEIKYSISNSSTSIYLDAHEIIKENAYPKVSYSFTPTILNRTIINSLYQYLNRIVKINDNELKLDDAYGYISGIDLDLDHPWQDSITVQNYKNKFEDIFSTITAQTESMQRAEYSLNETMQIVTTTGQIEESVLQQSLDNNMLSYSFNNNHLTLTEDNGLVGLSETGQVAYRYNGIFTADSRDPDGNWIWKSAILPSGINANLIRAGQLDTDKIVIYSGNQVRFQWNTDGLFAYKAKNTSTMIQQLNDEIDSYNNDLSLSETEKEAAILRAKRIANDIDDNQYVVFNSDGLSLVRKDWSSGIKQVEVSWNGFVMRNSQNEEIFYADSSTGDLTITGNFSAHGGNIGGWHVATGKLEAGTAPTHINNNHIGQYVALDTTGEYCILAGSDDAAYAPFSVKYDGTLNATSGTIGGWNIGPDFISSSTNINSESSPNIFLRSSGQNSGILLQNAPTSVILSIIDNNTYYIYQYTDDQNIVHTIYYRNTQSDNNWPWNTNEYTIKSNDEFYEYQDVLIAVDPKFVIVKDAGSNSNLGPQLEDYGSHDKVLSGVSGFIGKVEQTEANDYANRNNRVNGGNTLDDSVDNRIFQYYDSDDNKYYAIPYDGDADDADSVTASWYIKLKSICDASNSGYDIQNYVNYFYEKRFVKLNSITISDNGTSIVKELTVNTKIPLTNSAVTTVFSVSAMTGKVDINNGNLGNFILSPEGLSNGTITNTELVNSYITAANNSGVTTRYNLEKLATCFYKASYNKTSRVLTLTRLNGATVKLTLTL